MTKKEVDQLDDLLKNAQWKVLFSDNFRKSLGKLKGYHTRKSVLNLLLKLSGGWRPKNRNVDLYCKNSSHILKQFKVEGLYVICTIDIIKDCFQYIQVLKVWDVLPFEEIPKLAQRLDNMFAAYTDDYIRRCTTKLFEGNLEVPKSWPASQEVIRFRCLSNDECVNGGNCVENSKVSESLLLMKFYSLSSDVLNHLLSGKEAELPMQVTDEQMDVILFPKSSFIIGRSGTGKTTILTMKMFQNEQSFHVASEGIYEAEISDFEVVDDLESSKSSVLRQLFVTVSPKLCYAVKQHISRLITCNGNSLAEVNLDDADLTSEFDGIPNKFINIPLKCYPLVITFQKFIMMLDATLGNSFFERFLETREGAYGNHLSLRSVAVQTFIRSKEVTLDKFYSLYWPHFDLNLTKKLDPSRVFTEIISHIKGGLQAGESLDGKLSFEDYSLLAKSRASTLTKQKRETVYTLFEAYEKMKTKRGEFDLGDLVNDIHHRLVNGSYEGDQMDFVYIDEVQDLSMRQISLFKYICQNVNEGFMFAGDTAQTIGRGIDFRFQDIRSLFYKEFLSGKEEKRSVSETFQLKQNFRTHAGVLELAQSVIDVLYRYFVHSIDKLEPEVSLISGEAPVLLESGSDENVIATIFGGVGSSGEMVGFGAEQVILVRDDNAKTEICQYVGKHALVLTILECKGLEFQDVLLYNFFGTSPLKDQWRVIYGYMKEQDWLDDNLPQSFPTFSESRHSVLCSELKQLYVAITRTRQRIWICENKDDLSKPMFDFWKTRALVQIKKLDDSVAQAMRVASTPKEWRERGKKLFYENNFGMATMCFERAGDIMWEKLAKASGLRASADQMRETNHEAFLGYLREAAGIFVSIGKLESAASCYCDLGEYEKAAKFYTSGMTDEAATECFTVAGQESNVAEAYAKGDRLSDCLSPCKEGKFYEGLHWKEHANDQCTEIEHIDDLLVLEEESGRFLDASELARSTGDVLKEADLLGKAGHYKEAALLFVWYVFFSSLWGNGNRGWPLKQFAQKEEVCEKAKSLAEMESDVFFDFVCNELKILSEESNSLFELNKDLHASQEIKSLRGETLSIRKILDSHVHLDSSEYEWEDELPIDINKHCDEKTSQNGVSVRTLAFYWNLWKENVVDIFSSLEIFHSEEPHKHEDHVNFSLNYFGVRKYVKGNMVYSLANKDADWVRNNGQTGLHNDGKVVTIDRVQLVFAMRSYWQSELLTVGIKVLETLDALHKSKSNGSAFHQSTSLLHIFEVSKFLLDCQYLNPTNHYTKKLQRFLEISLSYFDLVFPLDWRKSETADLISLRRTDLSVNLLDEIILQNVYRKGNFTYWTIGRVMMVMCLNSRKSIARNSRKSVDLYEHLIKKLQNPVWKYSVEKLRDVGFNDISAIVAVLNALSDTLSAKWHCDGCISPRGCCISPHSFVYLLDHILFMSVLFTGGSFYTTKSSFVDWFTHHDSADTPVKTEPIKLVSKVIVNFFVKIIGEIFLNRFDSESWIQNSEINLSNYHPIFALKLVKILTLIALEEEHDYCEVLVNSLMGLISIARLLPKKFVFHLLKRKEGRKLNLNADMVAEAFMSIDDPLVIVSCSEDSSPTIHAPCAIFVDITKSKEEITSLLFSNKNSSNSGQSCSKNVADDIICDLPSSLNMLPSADANMNPGDGCKGGMKMNWKIIKIVYDVTHALKEGSLNLSLLSDPDADTIKRELDRNMHVLSTAHNHKKSCARKVTILVREAFNDLNMLSNAFDKSHQIKEHSLVMMVQEYAESLLSIKPKIDKFLKHSVTSRELKAGKMVVVSQCSSSSSSTSATKIEETTGDCSKGKKNKKNKGKKK